MGLEERKDEILHIINEKGPQGVNALATALGVPLSTMQKYLHNQKYFRINDKRRWDLPENVQADIGAQALALMVTGIETSILLLQTQLDEARIAADNLLVPTSSLKKALTAFKVPARPSVAKEDTRVIPERLNLILDTLENLPKIIKKRKEFVSEEVYNLLMSTDWLNLMLDNGKKVVDSVINPELQDVLLGEKSEFSEDVLSILLEYQD